jgi:hypothetical protein
MREFKLVIHGSDKNSNLKNEMFVQLKPILEILLFYKSSTKIIENFVKRKLSVILSFKKHD